MKGLLSLDGKHTLLLGSSQDRSHIGIEMMNDQVYTSKSVKYVQTPLNVH